MKYPLLTEAGAVVAAFICLAAMLSSSAASERYDPALSRIEQRLEEESTAVLSDPNSVAFLRAVGTKPARAVPPRRADGTHTLDLDQCLQMAFAYNNDVKQAREQIIAVGGSKIMANSRFLPTIELINQYEHQRNIGSDNANDDNYTLSATITQRILEFGKDNPIDITLRAEQRQALFDYENRVAWVFSQVRRAFLFIKLKERQIAARSRLLEQFEHQSKIKQQRMEAGNLSVKIEVLTARLNVLN